MIFNLDLATMMSASVVGALAYTAKTLLATTRGLAVLEQRQTDHEKADDKVHDRVTELERRVG